MTGAEFRDLQVPSSGVCVDIHPKMSCAVRGKKVEPTGEKGQEGDSTFLLELCKMQGKGFF